MLRQLGTHLVDKEKKDLSILGENLNNCWNEHNINCGVIGRTVGGSMSFSAMPLSVGKAAAMILIFALRRTDSGLSDSGCGASSEIMVGIMCDLL